MNKTKLIFATANAHKIEEVEKVINHDNFEFLNLSEVGITEDIVEDGETLEENALIKARYVFDKLGQNVFSEDTGLEVFSLGGEPGVYTARYAGPQKSASDNMDLLLINLESKQSREAQFRAVIALIINGKEVLFEGIIKGEIARKKSGKKGFGYDPIFIPEGYDKSFADLPEEVKLSLSHRSRAVAKLVDFLENS